MRLPIEPPPPWAYVERTTDGYFVRTSLVPCRPSEDPPAEAWGNLSYRIDNGLVVLLWSGTGCFQLQTGYFYPNDGTIHWSNEGSPGQGPAEITVSGIEQGSARYFRVVPCNEEIPE